MDTAFNLVKRVKFEYDDPTDITGDNYDDVKISYTRGYLGKRYFYAMFLGRSWKKHRENFTKGTFLEVFDLDGNPIIRYYLEGKCRVTLLWTKKLSLFMEQQKTGNRKIIY